MKEKATSLDTLIPFSKNDLEAGKSPPQPHHSFSIFATNEGGSGGQSPPSPLLEVGANRSDASTRAIPQTVKPVNWWQTKYFWGRERYPKVFLNLRKLSLCRRYKIDLVCTECGKDLKKVHLTCNSPLCPVCSREKWKIRTQKAFEALEPFLGIYGVWGMWGFTLPDTLREEAWNWEVLRDLRREAIKIIKEIVGGKVGIAVIQTFSSRNHSKKNPHFHLIVGGRKAEVDYVEVLEAWAGVLKKYFDYDCDWKINEETGRLVPVVVVQEGKQTKKRKGGPFLEGGESVEERKGVLYRKIMYEMRFPGQEFEGGKPEFTEVDLLGGGVFKHYELILGHQVYCYWGEVIRYFRGLPLESVPQIEKEVLLGSLMLSRQQKRRLVRELKKRGKSTHNLATRKIGKLEYQILKGLPLILKKSPKRRFDLCSNCGTPLTVLAMWDLLHSENSWVKTQLLEYLIAHFGDVWADYAYRFNQTQEGKKYGGAA